MLITTRYTIQFKKSFWIKFMWYDIKQNFRNLNYQLRLHRRYTQAFIKNSNILIFVISFDILKVSVLNNSFVTKHLSKILSKWRTKALTINKWKINFTNPTCLLQLKTYCRMYRYSFLYLTWKLFKIVVHENLSCLLWDF